MYKKNRKAPVEKANILSLFFFCWIGQLFKKISQKNGYLDVEDLDKVAKCEESENLTEVLRSKVYDENKTNGKIKLLGPLIHTFGFKILLNSSLAFIEETLRILQAIALANFMDYFNDKISLNEGILYGSLIIASISICTLIDHFYFWYSARLGLKMQVALRGLLYDKTIRSRQDSSNSSETVQNLFSNDLSALENLVEFLPYFIIAILQLGFVIYFLTVYVHYTFLAGALVLFMFLPLQFINGKILKYFRGLFSIQTDSRIALLKEMLSSIKIVKLNAYERYFKDKIKSVRDREVKYLRIIHMLSAVNTIIEIDMSVIVTFVSVAVLYYFEIPLKPAYIVYALAFYTRLNGTLGYFLSKAIRNGASTLVSLKRVEGVLNKRNDYEMEYGSLHASQSCVLKVRDLSTIEQNGFKLEGISFDVARNDLILITGGNGSGKSALLLALLGEISKESGVICKSENIFYVPQTPWVFSGTIEQNITFEPNNNNNKNNNNNEKYQMTINRCGLERDILKLGTSYTVNENGNNLSGGQKARINIARAYYSSSNICLFDEPLGSVDVEDSEAIRRNFFLAEEVKTFIIATHRVEDWELCANNRKIRVIAIDGGKLVFNDMYEKYMVKLKNSRTNSFEFQ